MSAFQPDVDAVTRGLETRAAETAEARGGPSAEGGELSVQTIAQSYATTVEDLWDAVTNPERLPRWFSPVRGELTLGGSYQVEGNAGGTIETCEPPRRFSATWEFNGQVSWIAVAVDPDGDRARLTLEHSAVLDPTDEEQQTFWATYGPGAGGVGWDLALLGLGHHLGGGEPVDPAAAEAWSVSPEGVAYVTACSARWGEVSVAAGTPRADAEAAAARTTAFYTGQPDPTTSGDSPEG